MDPSRPRSPLPERAARPGGRGPPLMAIMAAPRPRSPLPEDMDPPRGSPPSGDGDHGRGAPDDDRPPSGLGALRLRSPGAGSPRPLQRSRRGKPASTRLGAGSRRPHASAREAGVQHAPGAGAMPRRSEVRAGAHRRRKPVPGTGLRAGCCRARPRTLRRLGDGPGERRPGRGRLDDLVDDAELHGPVQPAGELLVLGGQLLPRPPAAAPAGTSASVRRCRMRIAATAPITATSASGQAKTLVAPERRGSSSRCRRRRRPCGSPA